MDEIGSSIFYYFHPWGDENKAQIQLVAWGKKRLNHFAISNII
jgi:hypothetical protein